MNSEFNLMVIFFTGLTAGGLSCLAMQGGLLAGLIANQKKDEQAHENRQTKKESRWFELEQLDWMPVGMFLVAKFVSHVLLGFLLGWLGSFFTLSLPIRLFFQTFTAFFMVAAAANLLNLHPIFRYVLFQPPAFMQRWVRHSAKRQSLFAPALLGFASILVPCGVTQAMEVLAINSASPVAGALIMGTFVLGTSPLFAIVGMATAKLSEAWSQTFTKVAAIVLILMAVYGFNGVLVVLDAPVTFQKIVAPVKYFFSNERFAPSQTQVNPDAVQKVTIGVFNNGYSPRLLKVKQGIPVELTLESNNTYSCALAFVFKEFGIETILDATDRQTFTFTPTKKGRFTFSCEMGMYTGILEVI